MHFMRTKWCEVRGVPALSRFAHLDSELFHAGKHGIERTEMRSGVIGNDPGQCRFADTGWAVEDQIANAIGCNRSAQKTTLGQNCPLADEFVEISGT